MKKIFETKDSTLKASPYTRGDKLPRIGSISSNIAPVKKPKEEEAIENMKTRFKILFCFLKSYSVYLHFIFYTMTIIKLLNEVYRSSYLEVFLCSENMQQSYRRTPMPKCNVNKVAL